MLHAQSGAKGAGASKSSDAKEVNKAGFKLQTSGQPEANDWNVATEPPVMKLNFSIGRKDTPFRGLERGNIQATLGGHEVEIKPADLVTAPSEASSVVLVLDASGSMRSVRAPAPRPVPDAPADGADVADVQPPPPPPPPPPPAAPPGLTKLSAAKHAVVDFLQKLGPEDRVAIIAFDEQQRIVYEISNDKAAAQSAVENLDVSPDTSKYTALYEAMKFAVDKARKFRAHNIVFLTDGMQDTPEYKALSQEQRAQYRREAEDSIAGLAKQDGGTIRIFTIGLGDQKASPDSLLYVDVATLGAISSQTNAGRCQYIDLPELSRTARSSPTEYHDALIEKLKDVLDGINKLFHYDYALTLHLDPLILKHDKETKVVIQCGIEQGDGVLQLPVEVSYTWDTGASRPRFGKLQALPVVFVPTPGRGTNWLSLARIYGLFGLGLILLALIPPSIHRLGYWRESSIARKCLVLVQEGSHYIGRECPNETSKMGRKGLIAKGETIVVCPDPNCHTPHHLGCWHMNHDTCWVRTCRRTVILSPDVLKKHKMDD